MTPKYFILSNPLGQPWGDLLRAGETRSYLEGEPTAGAKLGVKSWPKGNWPIVSGTSNGVLLLSEKAVETFLAASITGLAVRPVQDVAGWEKPKPANLDIPPLYALCPKGRLTLDEASFGTTPPASLRPRIKRMIPASRQPDALDFSLTKNHPGVFCICSINVLLTARKHHWNRFLLSPLDYFMPDAPHHDVTFNIDYLRKQWPPQWYPDGFEPHPNNLTDKVPADPLKKGPAE